MNTIEVTGRDELAAAIAAAPLDEDTTIVLLRKAGKTTYRFPAVVTPEGGEVNPHGRWDIQLEKKVKKVWKPAFTSNEAHTAYQLKRRAAIAADVRKKAKRYFE